MSNKDNILFVVPTLVGGGAEKTVANLSKYLNDFFNVIIVVIDDTEIKYDYSGKLVVLKKREDSSKLKKLFNIFSRKKELRKIKKENNIKCSISFLFQADLINILSKKKEKCIVSIRNKDSMHLEKNVYNRIMKYYLKKCDKVVAISNQVKDELIEKYDVIPNKVNTIYNPCLTIEFNKDDKSMKENIFGNNINFINMARLNNQKGQWHLIRAFKKVIDKYSDARLIILGTGDLEEYLNKLIKELNLEKNVFTLGFLDNPYDYLKRSDVFVFSSLFEGLGNSLLEAMSCDLPIISTDCECGPREILAPDTDYNKKVVDNYEKSKYGILTPVFDGIHYNASDPLTKEEELFADAMIELIENKDLIDHYKKMSSERIKDFDVNKIVKEWCDIIND